MTSYVKPGEDVNGSAELIERLPVATSLGRSFASSRRGSFTMYVWSTREQPQAEWRHGEQFELCAADQRYLGVAGDEPGILTARPAHV